jgi:hypothetical protein
MTAKTPSETRERPDASASIVDHISWILWARRNGGGECIVCGQHAQDYARTITRPMAHALLTFYQRGGTTQYVKRTKLLRKLGQRGGDDSKLIHWGLIETPLTSDGMPDGKKTGWARVTADGEDFIFGRITVSKIAWVYNSKFLEYDGEAVSFRTALGTDFDLDALLNTKHDA